jgi:hypothetical protein
VRVDFGNVTTVRCKRCGHSKYECAGLFIRNSVRSVKIEFQINLEKIENTNGVMRSHK